MHIHTRTQLGAGLIFSQVATTISSHKRTYTHTHTLAHTYTHTHTNTYTHTQLGAGLIFSQVATTISRVGGMGMRRVRDKALVWLDLAVHTVENIFHTKTATSDELSRR